jgi:hypothetical protein
MELSSFDIYLAYPFKKNGILMNNYSNKLPIFATIKASWEKVSGAKKPLWGVLLCMFVAHLLATGLHKLTITSNAEPISIGVLLIALTLILLCIHCGLIYMGVRRAMDLPIQFNMVKELINVSIIFRMIGLGILSFAILLPAAFFIILPNCISLPNAFGAPENTISVMQLISAVCFVIGVVLAVYLGCRMILAPAFVIVGSSGPWDAIKSSYKATKSSVWQILCFTIVNLTILIVSAIPLGIGLIWSLPYNIIAYGMIYKQLVVCTNDS